MSSHLTNEQLRLFGHWHRQFAAYLGSEVVNTALTESKTLSRPRFRDQDRPCPKPDQGPKMHLKQT